MQIFTLSLKSKQCAIDSVCCVLTLQTGQLEPLLNKFTAEEERQMKRMLQRVDILANVRMPGKKIRFFETQYFCNLKIHTIFSMLLRTE